MLRKKLFISFISVLVCMIFAGSAMALNGAGGAGSFAKRTNLVAVANQIDFLQGASLQVALLTNGHKIVSATPQITFTNNIDINGPAFYNAKEVIGIQYANLQPIGKELGVLFYSDNTKADGVFQFTGPSTTTNRAGLIGADGTTVAPIIFSMYNQLREKVTNFRGSLNGGNPYSKQPTLPLGFNGKWTNKLNNYDYDGYFSYLVDIGNTGYSWHLTGTNGCSLVNNIAAGALTTFDQAKQSPTKGNCATPSFNNMGSYYQFNGPFGGWVTANHYDSSWNYYANPGDNSADSLKDAFIYLAASFNGKAIQNYKTDNLVIEVYTGP